MELLLYNKHWKEGFSYNISFKRKYFTPLLELLENKFIINIFWLRRVGKTTLMRQLIDHLIENNISRESILFYSFDDFWQIDEVINEYFRITRQDREKSKIFIFFDEIQKITDWQTKLKIYYDLYPNFKFIISWSSSLHLTKKESLAGRIIERNIKPLYFEEYLEYKKLEVYLEKPLIFEQLLLEEFERYLSRQFIDIIETTDEQVREYMLNLKNKILKEDIVSFFRVEYPDLLDKIFRIISANPGMLLDYKNFANDIDIDQRTLEKYVYYLQEAFLIKKLYNYSPNLIKSERKLKKAYLMTTGFISDQTKKGEIFENYLVNTLDFEYFYRFSAQEVDFVKVLQTGEIIAIEAKYKNRIQSKDLRGLKHFLSKFKTKKNIVISKNYEWIMNNISIVPFYKIFSL